MAILVGLLPPRLEVRPADSVLIGADLPMPALILVMMSSMKRQC